MSIPIAQFSTPPQRYLSYTVSMRKCMVYIQQMFTFIGYYNVKRVMGAQMRKHLIRWEKES